MSPLILWALSVWAVLTFSGWGPPHFTHTRLTGLLTSNEVFHDLYQMSEGIVLSSRRLLGLGGRPDDDQNIYILHIDVTRTDGWTKVRQGTRTGWVSERRNISELSPLSCYFQSSESKPGAEIHRGVPELGFKDRGREINEETETKDARTGEKTERDGPRSFPYRHSDIRLLLLSRICCFVAKSFRSFKLVTDQRDEAISRWKLNAVLERKERELDAKARLIWAYEMENRALEEKFDDECWKLNDFYQKLNPHNRGYLQYDQAASSPKSPTLNRGHVTPSPAIPDRSVSRTPQRGFSSSWYKIRAVTEPPAPPTPPSVSRRQPQRRFGPLAINLPHGD